MIVDVAVEAAIQQAIRANPQEPEELDSAYRLRVLESLVEHVLERERHYQARLIEAQGNVVYRFISPEKQLDTAGNKHPIVVSVRARNLAAFAKENKLDLGKLIAVNNGEATEHKGWRSAAWRPAKPVYDAGDLDEMAGTVGKITRPSYSHPSSRPAEVVSPAPVQREYSPKEESK